MIVRLLGRSAMPEDWLRGGRVTRPKDLSQTINRAIKALAGDPHPEAGEALSNLAADPSLTAWRPHLCHAQAQQGRLYRDQSFKHPKASAVRTAIAGGPPVNAGDLRGVVMEELQRLRAELHTSNVTPWKRYWNVDSQGKVGKPLIENECRDSDRYAHLHWGGTKSAY
jgi:hypothetical protein